ncbi:transcriptional regulator [Paenibacillus sp. TRM 82003]|nr:transcriptional regulator [Paenibacillus sp. TRM 82003]
MGFREDFEAFFKKQVEESTGARRERLLGKGIGKAELLFLEKVWYPAIGHFEHLQLEWPVRDYKDKIRFIDLAYMPPGVKGAFEIMGFGPHARDVSRWRFKDLTMRHYYLALDGFAVLPVAYDWIVENPRLCQQAVLAFVGRYVADPAGPPKAELDWLELEVLRYARRSLRSFTSADIVAHTGCSVRRVRAALHSLAAQGLLQPAGGGTERVHRYIVRAWR